MVGVCVVGDVAKSAETSVFRWHSDRAKNETNFAAASPFDRSANGEQHRVPGVFEWRQEDFEFRSHRGLATVLVRPLRRESTETHRLWRRAFRLSRVDRSEVRQDFSFPGLTETLGEFSYVLIQGMGRSTRSISCLAGGYCHFARCEVRETLAEFPAFDSRGFWVFFSGRKKGFSPGRPFFGGGGRWGNPLNFIFYAQPLSTRPARLGIASFGNARQRRPRVS